MPPHTGPGQERAARPRRPSPLPPTWRCLRRTIAPMSRLCPGKEAEAASDDFRPTEEKGPVFAPLHRRPHHDDRLHVTHNGACFLVRRNAAGIRPAPVVPAVLLNAGVATYHKPRDTVGEFAALPATACGRSLKGSLNDPMKGDLGKFGREHG